MSKHTPGPWSQAAYEENVSGYTDEIIAYFEAKPVTICYFTNVSDGDHEDNAALIAAAPDLLEALKGIYNDCIEYIAINNLHGWERNSCLIKAKKAMLKAEGRK